MRLFNLAAIALAGAALSLSTPAFAQEHDDHGAAEDHGGGHHLKEPAGGWSFAAFNGTYDRNALQRGYRVYAEVCSSCHGMKSMTFRNLAQKGGPFYDAAYPNPNDNPVVKEIAKSFLLPSIDEETGDAIVVEGTPADGFPEPYANDAAGRGANGGALPPDLSVMAKARAGGASYIYSLLTGYPDHVPAGLTVNGGQHYNEYFHGDTSSQWAGDPRHAPAGGFLAMAPPLTATGQVTYDDGTEATVDQMAADVATYIAWASEPKMETRKQLGLASLAYLVILALLAFLSYRHLWRNIEH